MRVDFYACNRCGETFPDCGDYVSCECGNVWCDEECAKEDGFIDVHCSKYDVCGYEKMNSMNDLKECGHSCWNCEHMKESTCKYCRNEDYKDVEVLSKALELLNMTRQDVIKIINETK